MLTLGINYSQMHDSSACVVRDGELLFAVAEERLSRQKHDSRFPQLAIQACLDFAGIRAEQLDEVCFGWQTAGPVYRHDLKLYALGKRPVTYLNVLNSTRHFASMWHQESGAKRFAQHFGKHRGFSPSDLRSHPADVSLRQVSENGITRRVPPVRRLNDAERVGCSWRD